MTKDKTVTISRDLAPCPFCGSNKLRQVTDDGINFTQCAKCEATGPTGFKRGEDDAIDWNTRAAPVVERQDHVAEVEREFENDCGHVHLLQDLPDGTKLYTSPPAPVALEPDKYDYDLLPFVRLMRKELHANAGKGDRAGWLEMSTDTALLEIIYHFGKLQASVKRGDEDGIREYAADVANMCMMLVDICASRSRS